MVVGTNNQLRLTEKTVQRAIEKYFNDKLAYETDEIEVVDISVDWEEEPPFRVEIKSKDKK